MDTVTLTTMPPLAPLLAKGAALSVLKRRVDAGAALPRTRLVLPEARIDAARLAAYADICGFPVGEALPLPYPHVLGFPLAVRLMADRAFPLPLLGLVHTRIEIKRHGHRLVRQHRPELAVHAGELTPHRRGTEVVLVTEARLDGALVWQSRSSYLARHRTAYDDPRDSGPADAAPPPAVTGWRAPGDLGRRYGAASGDRNPIHLHPLTARLFGFPRAIAHGMWTFARCVAEAERSGGPAAEARAEFKAPVLLPADVTYAARTTGRGTDFELRGGQRVHLAGGTVSDGTSARPA
ncbi:MaoC/PaaZ C-terminal domain-containing protein [Streptomyces sp. NPDC048389]|uniref:MaoC/PaaZ C-terminal domain-containing protein n=1 Tax=Streptomyces sp. NPDC048389 TaxID=3154622 RepID=UPI0034543C82